MIHTLLFCIATILPGSFKGTQDNRIERAELLAPFFQALDEGTRPVRIVHIGDSHVRGHVFTVAVRDSLEKAWGSDATQEQKISYKTTAVATETGRPGLVYHAIGINGATCATFTDERQLAAVSALHPDLIIMSFGTNEAHARNYREEEHLTQMDALVKGLQSRNPEATIMLTTPPGAYRSTRVKYYRNGKRHYTYRTSDNPNTPLVVATQLAYAKEQGLPVWNLYETVGGKEHALTNWTGAKLMRADRIHYTDAGYTVMGRLLAEALIHARKALAEPQDEVTEE